MEGRYSNVMRGAYWYTQCKPYFGWGYDPCKDKSCYDTCVVMCERSYEFKEPGFLLHYHSCNLNCKFCWAYKVRTKRVITITPEQVVKSLLCKLGALCNDRFIMRARVKPLSIATIRLTGNEPMLQWDHTLDFLKILDDQSKISMLCQHVFEVSHPLHQMFPGLLHNLKILIQTNGVEIGRKDSPIRVEDLEGIRDLDVTFEVSFKGVNPRQFAWLADRPSDLFECQCAGFERLWKIRSSNLHIVAELGINHCENVKKYPELGVRIIDERGEPIDFTRYDSSFKEKVLTYTNLSEEENEFQEFGEIDKARARQVIETYSKRTGQIKKRCLPSEF